MSQIYKFDLDDAKRFALEQRIRVSIRGDEMQFERCPYCRNQTDKKNKFSININTGAFNCLRASCGAKGNMLTLARDFGFSLGRSIDEYYQPTRKYRNLRKFPLPKSKSEAVKYMEGRGISQKITERYKVTVSKDDPNVLIFLFYDEKSELQFIKYRRTDFDPEKHNSKEWCMSDCKPILFGMDQCKEDGCPLVLTEGQIDSLSVAEAYDGAVNAVSVPLGKNGFTWIPYCWDFLSRFSTLIVFGDYENDEITLLDEMRKRFRGKVRHVRPEDYKGCKDANDLLRKYGKQAVRDAVEQAEVVRNPKIVRLADVKRPDMSKIGKVIMHIPEADRMLGGLYFGQLVLLTGERGLGKSTLGSQLCVRAIDQGYNVFAYSGELADWMFQDWVDRQCAGPSNVRTRIHESGFEEPLVDADIEKAIKAWYAEQFLLYDNNIIEGDEYTSLIQLIEESISQYDCRVVFIDNLMTAIDDDTASDFYRQQSAFCRKLTEIAHRFEVLVILVAHPRKRNGSTFNNDDISGSGNIANLADVVMRYTTPNEDNATGADRLLQITKNRINGRVHYNDHGIPLYFEAKSKRIAVTQYGGDSSGIEFKLGWEAQLESEDGFLTVPDDIDIPFDSVEEILTN